MNDHSYHKYSDDQFAYDEKGGKKGSFIKQDSEFFNDEDYVPGKSVRVKRISTSSHEDWRVFINEQEIIVLKGIRFTSKEREFLRTTEGVMFIINGIKSGWKSVSEFKRQLQVKA
ncbi:hypothetical protein M0R72_02645 [Candidatus Pacearchaeota archaeon]|jgi:hypothetical protein|nr:hypothetical protein [Candidatus Pacearchaeota archaeon]